MLSYVISSVSQDDIMRPSRGESSDILNYKIILHLCIDQQLMERSAVARIVGYKEVPEVQNY